MKKAVCLLSIVPLRAHDTDTAELVSQLLFGEAVEIIEYSTKPNWIKVRNMFDGYVGWVDPKQIVLTDEIPLPQSGWVEEGFVEHNGQPKRLSIGSVFHASFTHNELDYFSRVVNYNYKDIVEVAGLYLGVPYLWGGRSQFGIDCSGFTQQVYKLCGINLPRDASQQALASDVEVSLFDYDVGDLAFFYNDTGAIIHVGIMLANDLIIHAHGEVKVNSIDEKGVLSGEGSYSHRLAFIKRFV